jgi:hypothetical protein
MRLFDHLDSDGDSALSAKEAEASGIRAENSAKVLNRLDTNGDGRVVRSEMMYRWNPRYTSEKDFETLFRSAY